MHSDSITMHLADDCSKGNSRLPLRNAFTQSYCQFVLRDVPNLLTEIPGTIGTRCKRAGIPIKIMAERKGFEPSIGVYPL
jgi:hypothetical protein